MQTATSRRLSFDVSAITQGGRTEILIEGESEVITESPLGTTVSRRSFQEETVQVRNPVVFLLPNGTVLVR